MEKLLRFNGKMFWINQLKLPRNLPLHIQTADVR